MAPIEAYWIILVLIFGAIGLVRGFLRELGVTMSQLVVMYAISEFFEKRQLIEQGMNMTGALLDRQLPIATIGGGVRVSIYTFLMVFVVFISYHGETLDFPGNPPTGPQGIVLNFLSGLVNGYLFIGTLWFYLNQYEYPLPDFNGYTLFQRPLSDLAQALVGFLPQALFPGWALLVFLFILIIARVIR